MAVVRCPHCANPLTHDEARTKTCPGCGGTWTGVVDAPPERDTWAPRSEVGYNIRLPESETHGFELGWGTVRVALALSGVGALMGWVGLLGFVSSFQLGPNGDILAVVSVVLAGFGFVQYFIGTCLTGTVPSSVGAHTLSVILYFCILFGVAVALFAVVGETTSAQRRFNRPEFWTPTARYATNLILLGLGLVNNLAYNLIVWMIARHFNRPGLAMSIMIYLIVTTILTAFYMAVAIEPTIVRFAAGSPYVTLWTSIGIVTTVVIWYVVHAFVVRSLITQFLLKSN